MIQLNSWQATTHGADVDILNLNFVCIHFSVETGEDCTVTKFRVYTKCDYHAVNCLRSSRRRSIDLI